MPDVFSIPDAALDDRLGFLGTAGAGKTYTALTAFLRVLARGGRGIWVDPLGVAWGIRLMADGKTASPWPVVIFGGPHGDLPINEHAGKLVGETVVGMTESAIVDLSMFATKAAERRFMLAFLEAMYRKAGGAPFHLVLDEADLWAPQKASEPQLQALTEQIVRRGRVKGFIPWLITQRPAVLSKDVLSQVDGLVALKLTSSQDRDAIGAWIEGQADKAEWAKIRADLPTLPRGRGVVWIPGRQILETVTFPPKPTFDSSASPVRGKKAATTATLQPLDVGALRERLASVEIEAKANDPKALKAEISNLKRQMMEAAASAARSGGAIDPKAIEDAEQRGYERGRATGFSEGKTATVEAIFAGVDAFSHDAGNAFADTIRRMAATVSVKVEAPRPNPKPTAIRQPVASPAAPLKRVGTIATKTEVAGLTGPQAQVLRALAWWRAMGHARPSRPQVAGIAGWKITSGHLKNVVGSLRSAGLVDYPEDGRIEMTPAGIAAAPDPDLSMRLHDGIRSVLTGPQRQIFDALIKHSGGPLDRDVIASELGWEPTSGHLKNVVGSLRTLEIVDYPRSGAVALQSWVFA